MPTITTDAGSVFMSVLIAEAEDGRSREARILRTRVGLPDLPRPPMLATTQARPRVEVVS